MILRLIAGTVEKDAVKPDETGLKYLPIFGLINDSCINKATKDRDIAEGVNTFKHPNLKTSIKFKFSNKFTIKHFAGCVT